MLWRRDGFICTEINRLLSSTEIYGAYLNITPIIDAKHAIFGIGGKSLVFDGLDMCDTEQKAVDLHITHLCQSCQLFKWNNAWFRVLYSNEFMSILQTDMARPYDCYSSSFENMGYKPIYPQYFKDHIRYIYVYIHHGVSIDTIYKSWAVDDLDVDLDIGKVSYEKSGVKIKTEQYCSASPPLYINIRNRVLNIDCAMDISDFLRYYDGNHALTLKCMSGHEQYLFDSNIRSIKTTYEIGIQMQKVYQDDNMIIVNGIHTATRSSSLEMSNVASLISWALTKR